MLLGVANVLVDRIKHNNFLDALSLLYQIFVNVKDILTFRVAVIDFVLILKIY